MRSLPLFALALVVGLASPAAAQDVELLGRIHGTRPPDAYFERRARDADAYEFRRGWRVDDVLEMADAFDRSAAAVEGPLPVLGQREGVVEGTFAFPLLLGLFADSPLTPDFTRADVQRNFFDGPNDRGTGTIPDFYDELSGGKVALVGETTEWVRSDYTRAEVAGGVSGLSNPGMVWAFISDVVAKLDEVDAVNWALYDNDGPDGLPNSGDDDGYVDVLSILHPTRGAECSPGAGQGNLIWSHRWSIRSASGQDIVTQSTGFGGNPIRIDDYTIQPLLDCTTAAVELNRIGVFAHELGHGFGLPDLYDTVGNSHAAAGEWDLMASGAWGCRGYSAILVSGPARPCHMGAWSKAILGWVDVTVVPPGSDLPLTIEPVQTAGRVYRVDAADGSGDYFLLENRQPLGFDSDIHGPGLLVWQIDQATLLSRWPSNRVNADRMRMGVRVRQADGVDDLGREFGNRGDAGDPFPGAALARAFHYATVPQSTTSTGGAAGLTLLDVETTGADISLRLIAGYRTLSLATADAGTPSGTWQIGSAQGSGPTFQGMLAPFQSTFVSAPAGLVTAPGIRDRFAAWAGRVDPRGFQFQMGLGDESLLAEFGPARDFLIDVGAEPISPGFETGSVALDPPLSVPWYGEGIFVQAQANPAPGFTFDSWIGDLSGSPNPVLFPVNGPLAARAIFTILFDADRFVAPFLLSGAEPGEAERDYLDATGNGNGRYDVGDLRAFLAAGGGGS